MAVPVWPQVAVIRVPFSVFVGFWAAVGAGFLLLVLLGVVISVIEKKQRKFPEWALILAVLGGLGGSIWVGYQVMQMIWDAGYY